MRGGDRPTFYQKVGALGERRLGHQLRQTGSHRARHPQQLLARSPRARWLDALDDRAAECGSKRGEPDEDLATQRAKYRAVQCVEPGVFEIVSPPLLLYGELAILGVMGAAGGSFAVELRRRLIVLLRTATASRATNAILEDLDDPDSESSATRIDRRVVRH